MNDSAARLRATSAVQAIKRTVPVSVEFALSDGICATLEGPVAYQTGDAILTGVAGESWPMPRARFDERYRPIDTTSCGENGTYVKRPMTVSAVQLTESIELSIAGGVLSGNAGDWLLEYGPGDYGIVRGDIFLKTYCVIEAT